MSEKQAKPITNRHFSIFGGIGLILLSLVLTVNMWVVARVLSFPFFFIFGILSYVLFAYMFVQGMWLLVRKHPLKIGFSLKSVGVVLTFLSTSLLVTTFYKPAYSISTFYDSYVKGLNYLTQPRFINFFITEEGNAVAGGFIGVVLYDVLNNIAAPVPYIIGFLVLFIGLAFIFMNPILGLITNYQEKARPKKGPKKPKSDRKVVEEKEGADVKDFSSDVIRGASVIDRPEETQTARPISSGPAPVPLNPGDLGIATSDMSFRSNDGVFKPAHFVPGVIPGDTPSSVMTPVNPVNAFDIPEETPAAPVKPVEAPKEEKPVKTELVDLFEEPATVIDEKLVTAAPEFSEPVAAARNDAPVSSAPAAPVNPPKKKIKWIAPSAELLEVYEVEEANNANIQVAEQRTLLINQILADYKVGAQVEGYTIGPSVTRYNVKYDINVQTKAVENVVKDIARRLGGVMCRFEPMVRGTEYSGLEIPNAKVTTVSFKDVYEQLPDVKRHPTAIAFGKNIQGEVISADFNEFPHILVAGTTGSGKSIFIHSIISTLIMRNSPDNLKLVLVDPKRVEMVKYREIPHLLCPIINDPKKAKPLLDKLVDEMNARYDILSQGNGFSNTTEYNEYAEQEGLEKIPTIVAVLDEYGDLVETCKEISRPVLLLGQKARACGIHILIATQSPTSDIITGPIKSNLPTHVALSTSNATQSVTILGEGGAEKLLGKGDMLVQCPKVERGVITRLQGCYISNKEITRVCSYLRDHYPTQYDENFLNLEEEATVDGQLFVANGGNNTAMDDAEEMKYQSIKEWVMSQQYTSMSRIQGDCGVGFNRARRFFNRLVQEGIINPMPEGNKGSKVLVHDSRSEINPDDIPVSDELSD